MVWCVLDGNELEPFHSMVEQLTATRANANRIGYAIKRVCDTMEALQ